MKEIFDDRPIEMMDGDGDNLVFHYEKGSFRRHENSKVRELATKGVQNPGFFKVLVSTKSNRFVFFAEKKRNGLKKIVKIARFLAWLTRRFRRKVCGGRIGRVVFLLFRLCGQKQNYDYDYCRNTDQCDDGNLHF